MQKKIHLFYKDFKIYFIAIATLFGFMAFQEFINFEKIKLCNFFEAYILNARENNYLLYTFGCSILF